MPLSREQSIEFLADMIMGRRNFGVRINSAVLPDTRELLKKKGYLVKGADVDNTQYVLIVGHLAHAIPAAIPKGMVDTMHEILGIKFIDMTSDELHKGLLLTPDCEEPEYYDEMQAIVREVDMFAQKHKSQGKGSEADETDDSHEKRLRMAAILPSGKVLEAVICRDCAMDFIEGRSEGERYHRTDFLRTLMAIVISHADEEHAEKIINEKVIKASLEKVTKH